MLFRAGQFGWGLGSFNGMVGLCISVSCARLGVLWRFCRRVVMDVSKTCVAHIFSDLKVTNHIHVALYYQQFPLILIPHLDNKMCCNENPHFVTLLAHCVSAAR